MTSKAMHDSLRGVALAIQVTLGNSECRIKDVDPDGIVSVALRAVTPLQANAELCGLLGKTLHTAEANIAIVAGEAGTRKLVSVMGVTAEAVQQTMQPFLRNG